MTNPAAWHPDPTGGHEYRWWDGSRWTEHVADGGQASVDPLPGTPGADTSNVAATATAASDSGTDGGSSGEDSSIVDGSDDVTREQAATGAAAWQQPEATDSDTTAQQQAQSWQQPQQTWQQPDQGSWGGGAGGQPPSWQQTPAWSQPGGEQHVASGTNGIAIAAMVIGILSLLIAFIPFVGLIGAVGGVLALVLGFIGRKRAKDPTIGGNGLAIAGIVTGILALLLSIVITIAIFAFGSQFMGTFDSYADCISSGRSEAECDEELERDLMDRFGQ